MKHLFLLFFSLLSIASQAQVVSDLRVMWYNVENLFDVSDEPDRDDDPFLPAGERRWTPRRYRHKLNQIAKVIAAAGEWSTPALIGLCEVENDSVLIALTRQTPLREQHYRYCLAHSSDVRGINIALLYQRDKFAYISHTSLPIRFSGKRQRPTRDILHVCGMVQSRDTLDLLLCHFPSRYGGEKETENDRMDAALTLRALCDSLHRIRQKPHLLVMGDFNDAPEDRSMRFLVESDSSPTAGEEEPLLLHNLLSEIDHLSYPGTHKYQGTWLLLDQLLVNRRLLDEDNSIHLLPESVRLFAPSFLMIHDKTGQGMRPKRSYYGYTYEGGFSDHLPILADFRVIVTLPDDEGIGE